jgi:hypothetical protein
MTRSTPTTSSTTRIAPKKQPLRYNNFGGTFSGPIQLPKKIFGPFGYNGRDRTFFFFSYEGQRFLLPHGAVLSVVPSTTARRNAPNDYARQVLNAFPVPNGADILNVSGSPTGGANFTSAYSEPSASNARAAVATANRSSDARVKYCGVVGAPTTFLDGQKFADEGVEPRVKSAAEKRAASAYSAVASVINKRLETPSQARLRLDAE